MSPYSSSRARHRVPSNDNGDDRCHKLYYGHETITNKSSECQSE